MKRPEQYSHELPQEVWTQAAGRVLQFGMTMAAQVEAKNFAGRGKQDADDLMTDIQLAYTAMMYVAKFAKDKCRIITVD